MNLVRRAKGTQRHIRSIAEVRRVASRRLASPRIASRHLASPRAVPFCPVPSRPSRPVPSCPVPSRPVDSRMDNFITRIGGVADGTPVVVEGAVACAGETTLLNGVLTGAS